VGCQGLRSRAKTAKTEVDTGGVSVCWDVQQEMPVTQFSSCKEEDGFMGLIEKSEKRRML
jgi:hypothetical protein